MTMMLRWAGLGLLAYCLVKGREALAAERWSTPKSAAQPPHLTPPKLIVLQDHSVRSSFSAIARCFGPDALLYTMPDTCVVVLACGAHTESLVSLARARGGNDSACGQAR